MSEPRHSRRDFIHSMLGVAVAGNILRSTNSHAAKIRFGYASITWNGKDLQAIDEIASLGFPGIQLRSNILPQFETKAGALKELLAQRHLEFVAFSSGAVTLDRDKARQAVDEHVAHARFLRSAGGRFLQITDERPAGRAVTPDDCARLGGLLTQIGRRTAEFDIPVAYHPHMGTVGEKPEDSDRVLAHSDPRFVKLLLDVAHYQQGGGDPVAAIRRHRERLALLHLKDVAPLAPSNPTTAPAYRFVELGRGRVDLKGVLAALSEIGFDGWCVVELDDVPDPTRTPIESARLNKSYLESLGYTIRG
jgi:inosose dehydratase